MKKNIGNVAGAGTSANVTKNVSRRALAAVLALVFALSCFLGLNFALRAKGADWADSDMEGAKEVNKGLVLNKGLRQNGDTYEVRLEAKATGSAVNQSLAKNSPLDVVVVKKDGGDKMETEDVVSQYNPIDASPLTIADIQQGEYYVKVGDKYREVKTKEFYKAAPENLDSFPGTAKASWTAQSAHDWVYADPDNPRHLYYGDNHKMVFAAPDVTFSERLSSISVLGSEVSHTTTDPTYGTTNYFFYVPHTGTGADDKSAWHRLYYQQNYEDVWLSRNDKYYYTFFYFKDSVEKVGNWPNISSGTAGKTVGSVVLLNNFKSCGCSGNTTYSSINGYTSSFTNNNTNTTNGKLYTFSNQNTTKNYNILYVENSDNSYFYLACQDISDTNTSHTYNGTLETKAHRLYYLGDNGEETLGEVWNTTDKPYDGTLYTADKISRTAAMESAIEAFQDQLNANGLYDADHYKEVSYSGDNLGTGLSAAESWFSEHNCSESRKKIIVLFSDDVASPDTAIAQRLKDNEVTIYTVGLYPSGTVDSTVRDNLKKVSSETFKGSSASASGTFNYSATDKTSLIKHYTSIANAVTQPSTTLVLGRDTVLKDIISENFVTDLEKRGKTKVTIETVDAEGKVTSNPSGVEYAWEADEKTLTVTGFDYCKNPNTTLRVTITGLEKVYDVKKSIENNQEVIYSNDPNSGIYYDGGRALLAAFPMPSIPYNEETAAAPELHSMNVAIREQFATLTDIVSTLSGNATFQAELLEVDGVSAENSEQWDYDPAIYDRTVELPAVTLSTKVSDYDDNDGIADSHEWSTDR
ncbi:MAG: VWA domain-containing protein, partial [Prevotella sp.]|nr:VWA domain-containing protein [Prevotella sp.]